MGVATGLRVLQIGAVGQETGDLQELAFVLSKKWSRKWEDIQIARQSPDIPYNTFIYLPLK